MYWKIALFSMGVLRGPHMTPWATVVFVDTRNFGGRPAFLWLSGISWAHTLFVVGDVHIIQALGAHGKQIYQF